MTKSPAEGNGKGIALRSLLDEQHPLVQFTLATDWESLCRSFEPYYQEDGRPSVPVRILIGLHYLKTLNGESDESVVAKWVENPYWQFVCGCDAFHHQLPLHPSGMSRWRKRVGESGLERMFRTVLQTAMKVGAMNRSDLREVTADTTVQEKAIAYPTDARLYHKARRALVRIAKANGIKLIQTYEKAGKRALFKSQRYASAQQFKRARRQTRLLRTLLGRVIRDVSRKQPNEAVRRMMMLAKRIHAQKREDSPKLYSVHAPEVECIAKGKAHKRYEFGCKVSFTATTASNWLVGIQAMHGNPYDGATLGAALAQVERMTGCKPTQALVDQGYRGATHHPAGVKVLVAKITSNVKASLRNLLKRRSAVEPIISHTKFDHGLCRNHLLGQLGDKLNALLAGCGFNLAKLLRAFATQTLSSAKT